MRKEIATFYRLFPLLLLIFIDSFSFFVIIPVLLKIFYHNHYGLLSSTASLTERNTLTGIVIAVSMLSALLFAPLVGRLSDKYGRKKTLLYCVAFVFLGFLLPMLGILKKNIMLVFIGRFVSGIGSASQPVAQAAVADLCQGEEKALYLGFVAFMMTLALIVAPLAGSVLSDGNIAPFFHAITPFVFSLALTLLSFVLIAVYFTETLSEKNVVTTVGVFETLKTFSMFIKRYKIGILILLFFCLELAWSQYYQSIPLLLKLNWHLPVTLIGTFSAGMGLTMAIGLMVIYPLLIKKFVLRKILRMNILGAVLGLLGCALSTGIMAQWFFACFVALTVGMAYVSLVAIISNKVDPQHQGILMGALSTCLYCAWMLTAFDNGFLMRLHQNMPLYLSVVFLGLGVVVRAIACQFAKQGKNTDGQ